jgi:aerobic-type carbon monoxide dehydrogenase small subunit (CoxS/CutS family)
MPEDPHADRPSISRRSFLVGAGGVAATGALAAGAEPAPAPLAAPARSVAGPVKIQLTINGKKRNVQVEPRTTLLSLLRVHLDPPLTGTKEVCDRGACGACTVLLDDLPVNSCSLLALDCVGREIRTIEGEARGGGLSPVQRAFAEHDALMCGYCTPGFVMSVTACLEGDPKATADDVRRECAGNLCRCGTYPQVLAAAAAAGPHVKRRKQR